VAVVAAGEASGLRKPRVDDVIGDLCPNLQREIIIEFVSPTGSDRDARVQAFSRGPR
jgi:hypothetical protein